MKILGNRGHFILFTTSICSATSPTHPLGCTCIRLIGFERDMGEKHHRFPLGVSVVCTQYTVQHTAARPWQAGVPGAEWHDARPRSRDHREAATWTTEMETGVSGWAQ